MAVPAPAADPTPGPPPLGHEPRPAVPRLRDRVPPEWAYLLPMLVFLGFTQVGGSWPVLFPAVYVAKTVVVAGLLVWLWPAFTRIRWNHWWLGVLLGVVGIFQWVGMQLWLQDAFAGLPKPFRWFQPSPADEWFDPFARFGPGWGGWAFVAIRVAGAVLVVPVMEELFWRDYLWRRVVAPNDFKLAAVGEWDKAAYVVVAVAFAVVHGNWWLTSIVWALMIGGLLAYTKSLGACIAMHATTNLLLAGYVLWTRDWSFW
ncbi:MAG: amino terminal protease self-immunity [Phycisphaerales bacterium]|nr:amino terminal protease self-immunity [Phycisphaerales bacterium]